MVHAITPVQDTGDNQPTVNPPAPSGPREVRITGRMLEKLCGELRRLSRGQDTSLMRIVFNVLPLWEADERPAQDEDAVPQGEELPDTWRGEGSETSTTEVPAELLEMFLEEHIREQPREILSLTLDARDAERLLGVIVSALQQPSKHILSDTDARAVLSGLLCQLLRVPDRSSRADRTRHFTLTGWLLQEISEPLRSLGERAEYLPLPPGTEEDLPAVRRACGEPVSEPRLGEDAVFHGELAEQAAEDLNCLLVRALEEPEFADQWASLAALHCQIS
jgi:hypothetical protein